MATEVVVTVRSSGGDYTSLSSAEAGEQRNLVSANEIAVIECYDDWPSGLSDTVTVAGYTVDSTRYVRITVASGNRHNGIPGAGFWLTSGSATTLFLQLNYTVVEFLEVVSTATSGVAVGQASGGYGSMTMSGLLAKGGSTGTAFNNIRTGGVTKCCLAYNSGTGFQFTAYNVSNVLNCVSAGNTTGYSHIGGTVVMKNCVAYGNTTNFGGSYDVSSTNNATSSGSDDAPGGSSVTGVVSGDFEDTSGNDYHLASGSALIGAGTNLYSDFTEDIDGETWPSSGAWDIGFDYYVSAGGGPPTLTWRAPSVTSTTFTPAVDYTY